MDIKLPIKLHNRFDIEVKDITTNKVVQNGYAENIVLDVLKTTANVFSTSSSAYFGKSIAFGSGTGILSPSRTTLFNYIASINSTLVEIVLNQVPSPSYRTTKIVLSPESYVEQTITEVGIGHTAGNESIYTHALIKDSEGNSLTLTKTNTQEITIYSTVYVEFNSPLGLYLPELVMYTSGDAPRMNGLILGLLGHSNVYFASGVVNSFSGSIYIEGNNVNIQPNWTRTSGKLASNLQRIPTSIGNGKIKNIEFKGKNSGTSGISYPGWTSLGFNFETMAENNTTMWGGYEFDKTPVGVGDGNQTVFNLTWDEAWLTKPYKVYADGVEVTSGFTFNTGNITFNTAPADQAVITADYWVKYVPKDINHVLDFNIEIVWGEGA